MSLDGPRVALILLGILLPLVGLGIYLFERRHGRRRRTREPERLPLFGTDQLSIRTMHGYVEEDEAPVPAPAARVRPRAPEPRPTTAPAPPRPVAPHSAPVTAAPPSTPPVARPPQAAPPLAPPAPRPSPVAAGGFGGISTAEHPVGGRPAGTAAMASPVPDTALIEGETLRFSIPTDGTVEFLPGRLEVVAGPEAGREIRFARALGEAEVEVTFGRSEGPANRHVQILARTVSRRHAVMTLIDEHWQLTNLSSTNPVVLNGRVLAGNEVAPLLVEGDRIEMGEVAFIFHDV